jgi:glycosyltransferase involved in cell wall biosynthesis
LRIFDAARFCYEVRRLLKSNCFDRVVAHFYLPSGLIAACSSDVPVEIVCHGSDVHLATRLPFGLGSVLLAALSHRSISWRFVSHQLRADLLATAKYSRRARAMIAGGAVSPALLSIGDVTDKPSARRSLALSADTRVVLIVSRLLRSKRIESALAIATEVADLKVIVIGTGPEQRALQQRFPSVSFLGRLARPQTLVWLRAADTLLSASTREGAPTAIREARFLGTPVAARRCGDLPLWAQRDTGIFLADDDQSLRSSLRQALRAGVRANRQFTRGSCLECAAIVR